jgi:hypothetical protein
MTAIFTARLGSARQASKFLRIERRSNENAKNDAENDHQAQTRANELATMPNIAIRNSNEIACGWSTLTRTSNDAA